MATSKTSLSPQYHGVQPLRELHDRSDWRVHVPHAFLVAPLVNNFALPPVQGPLSRSQHWKNIGNSCQNEEIVFPSSENENFSPGSTPAPPRMFVVLPLNPCLPPPKKKIEPGSTSACIHMLAKEFSDTNLSTGTLRVPCKICPPPSYTSLKEALRFLKGSVIQSQ